MAKSKHGRALFDLFPDEGREGSEVLEARQRAGRRGDGIRRRGLADGSIVSGGQAAERPRGRSSEPAPFAELDGARIRLSFTSFTAGVAIFAIMVLLLGAYELGHRSGDGEGFQRGHAEGRQWFAAGALSEIEAARRQPVDLELVESLFVGEPGALADPPMLLADGNAGVAQPGSDWIRDYTYVVAQEFSAGREADARLAATFLLEHGVATELVTYPSGAMQLITAQGYDRTDPAQHRMAEELKNNVRAIGVQYFASGGGYKLEGYFKALKGDTW